MGREGTEGIKPSTFAKVWAFFVEENAALPLVDRDEVKSAKESMQFVKADTQPRADEAALSAEASDAVLARSEDVHEQLIVGTSEQAIPVDAAIVTPSKDAHEQIIVGTSESVATIEVEVDVNELRIDSTSKPGEVAVQSFDEQEESINDTAES
ncbi:hypothetical protein PFISCL1PPCAC_16866, partial [Pristionchus fissidentatus]